MAVKQCYVTSTNNTDQTGKEAKSADIGLLETKPSAIESRMLPRLGELEKRLVVMSAEPGMGKSHIASEFERRARDVMTPVYRSSFDEGTSEQAAQRIIRFSRKLCKDAEPGMLVIMDGITPPDEQEAASEGRAINRLVEAGARVVVCMRPESEQLIENLDGPVCLRAHDLLMRSSEYDEELMALTGGIPALVVALAPKINQASPAAFHAAHQRYIEALESVLSKTIREGMPAEEQRVRIAMLLLGSGTLEEVSMIAGRCDFEQFQWLERDVPLFGIEARNRTFCCHGLSRDAVYEACASALRSLVIEYPQLVVRACGVLAAREDVRRSILTSRLCVSEDDHMSVCIAWGVSYAAAGEAKTVGDAVRRAETLGIADDARATLSSAASRALLDVASGVDAVWERLSQLKVSSSTEARLHQRVMLLGACRDTLRSPRNTSKYLDADPRDSLGLACLDHIKLARMLSVGHFEEAYSLATNNMLVREAQSVPEAMICDDVLLALALGGGAPDAKERHFFERAEDFYAQSDLRRMSGYHAAIVAASRILMTSETDSERVEEAAVWAERAGDTYMQGLCLFVCSVADIRLKAYSRAHVRAQKASEICLVLGEDYLASASQLTDALALEALGEVGALSQYCEAQGRPEGMALIAQVAARVVDGKAHEAVLEIPTAMPFPRDSLWVLNTFSNDCPELWEGMAGAIPATWLELLRAVRYRQERSHEQDSEIALQAPGGVQAKRGTLGTGNQAQLLPVQNEDARISVSVLGSLSIECNGASLPEGALERRRAKDLIILLALAPGHRMRRYQAIEVLWGSENYYKGPRKLYEATGEARKRLGELCDGENVIIADRSQGSIGFDASLVRCDVDDFEREARLALAEDGDDFWVLEHARRMAQLYSSGPDERLEMMGDLIADRVHDLETLYVDGAIAAGEAALRLGKGKLAVRYGMDAHRIADLRDDAMILLVRALKLAGRSYEIPDYYKRYCRHLIEVKGVPPSLALRRIVELALKDEPDMPLT